MGEWNWFGNKGIITIYVGKGDTSTNPNGCNGVVASEIVCSVKLQVHEKRSNSGKEIKVKKENATDLDIH